MKASPLLVALAAVALAAVAMSSAPRAAPPAVSVIGEDGKTLMFSAQDLDALPQASATISHDGKSYGLKGALLYEVLKKAGAPLDAAMRGAALSDVVIVSAADGYVVTLALSDLEPSIRPGKVILADATAEGAPLGRDGPFRLVIDGDLKPARSERNVVAIEVRRLRGSH
jgi:hypothetical protein